MRSTTCWLLAMLLAAQARAVLQVDVPAQVMDEGCLGSLQARLVIRDSPRAWPATTVLPPSGHPAMWHVVFAYDEELRGRTVERVELQVGDLTRSWKPEPLQAGYPLGPAFPVTARMKAFGPCPAVGADAFQITVDSRAKLASFRVRLDREGPLRLEVLDLLGNPVAALSRGVKPRGLHGFQLATAGLPSGLYLVKLELEGRKEIRKLLLS